MQYEEVRSVVVGARAGRHGLGQSNRHVSSRYGDRPASLLESMPHAVSDAGAVSESMSDTVSDAPPEAASKALSDSVSDTKSLPKSVSVSAADALSSALSGPEFGPVPGHGHELLGALHRPLRHALCPR